MRTTKWALHSIIDLYKKAEVSDTSGLNPDLVKYFWLADALATLFNKSIDEKFNNDFTLFVLENKAKIDKTVPASPIPQVLGKGKDGIALQIAGNLVFKIFLNDGAYLDAKDAMERLHTDPTVAKTEAMIYDVGTFGKFLNVQLYYYIIEKMIPITEQSKEVSVYLNDIVKSIIKEIHLNKKKWEELKIDFLNPETREEAKRFLKTEISQTIFAVKRVNKESVDFFNQNAELRLKSTWLSSLVEEIFMKYLTSRTDVHFGNLGITNFGEFRYFDPSHSKSKDRIMNAVVDPGAEDETVIH